MDLKKMLMELSEAKGVSGTSGAIDAAEQYLAQLGGSIKRDIAGGIACVVGNGKRKIMLDAHIDEIGFVVTAIEDGFIRVAKCGGIDPRTVINQHVTIHGSRDIVGVFASTPPHLKSDEKSAPKVDELLIDCGYSDSMLKEIVKIGDRVSFLCEPRELLNDRITGKSLDNRAGVCAIISAAEKIVQSKADCTLIVSLSAQEELGCRGARTAAFEYEPDEAIVVDVSFGDGPDVASYECGKLGKGAMIGVSPILDRKMTDGLFDAAESGGFAYQTEAMGGSTGTNADFISLTKSGIPTALVSIPLRNMHTCCEVIDISDVESTAGIIAEYVCGGGDRNA